MLNLSRLQCLPVEVYEEEDEVVSKLHHRLLHVSFQLTAVMNLSRIIDSNIARRLRKVPVATQRNTLKHKSRIIDSDVA